MSFLDNIRNVKLFGKKETPKSLYTDEYGNPKTVIASAGSKSKGISTSDRGLSQLKTYWKYYNGEGTIFASINITAWNTIMVGFHLLSEDKNAKDFLQSQIDQFDLESVLLDSTIYTLIYGDAFIEKVKDTKGNITSLKCVDPSTMFIQIDEYGRVLTYQQIIPGQSKGIVMKPEEIMHFKFFSRPDKPYGISLLEPSKDTIDRKVTSDESISNAIIRHGTSKFVVKVGNDKSGIPPASAFQQIKNTLEDLSASNEIIVPGMIDIIPIDEKGIAGVEEYFNYFQTQLIIGLLCPEEALGLGRGSTEATASVKQIMYERMIKSFQFKIANILRLDLLNDILVKNGFQPNIVTVKFNSVTDADEADKAKWLGNLLRGFPDGQKPFSTNEIRAMFGFPDMKEDIPLPVSPQQSPTQQPQEPPVPTPQPPQPESQPQQQSVNNDLETRMSDVENKMNVLRDKLNARE